VTGLAAGTLANLTAVSQVTDASRDRFHRLYFRTANQTAVEGPPRLNGHVVGRMEDFIGDEAPLQSTWLVAVAIENTGGNAANVQLTALQPANGWRLASPVSGPLAVGSIGSGGTATVVVRLVRDGPVTLTPAGVSGSGTFTGADGAVQNFTIGGS
jgi:hypothetical protein